MSNFNFQAVAIKYFNEDHSRAIFCDPHIGLWTLILVDGDGNQSGTYDYREKRKDAEAWLNEPLATC